MKGHIGIGISEKLKLQKILKLKETFLKNMVKLLKKKKKILKLIQI